MPVREIKFRGWHTTQKKMYSAEQMANDQLTLLPTGEFINVNGRSTSLSVIYPKDKFIPLQFTGLHDKNSKEEYHKDIVKSNLCNSIGVIEWDDKVGSWYYQWQDGKKTYPRENYDVLDEEVIGNIYENPELLGKGE